MSKLDGAVAADVMMKAISYPNRHCLGPGIPLSTSPT
jgi:hypothetical protein